MQILIADDKKFSLYFKDYIFSIHNNIAFCEVTKIENETGFLIDKMIIVLYAKMPLNIEVLAKRLKRVRRNGHCTYFYLPNKEQSFRDFIDSRTFAELKERVVKKVFPFNCTVKQIRWSKLYVTSNNPWYKSQTY